MEALMWSDRAGPLLAHEDFVGGAPLEDLVPATLVAFVAVVALALFGVAHRRGRTLVLTRLATFSERVSGLPGWAALPAAITVGSLLVAVVGFYWDVATHIDNGRDPGPFANPAHFLIIGGLAGIALAGVVALLLGRDGDPSAITIRPGWHVPVGGVLLFLCGGIAVLGFPLDDVWHRLFGQDVTLWSPTHIQMVGGAALSTLALWVLYVEGRRDAGSSPPRRRPELRESLIAGAFLVGLSALQAEFDYSVPQFRLLYHPVLLMASSGVALVAARIRLGRGGALAAALGFVVLRALLSLLVGPVLGHTTLHFPLYLAEALVVEGVALRVPPTRQLSFAAWAGVAIGTVGLAAEWGWSHLWMTMSWPASLWPEALVVGMMAAVAGALTGGFIGRALSDLRVPRQRASRSLVAATVVAFVLVIAYPFPTTSDVEGSVDIAVTRVDERPGWGRVEVTVTPRSLAEDSEWFNVTAWQGGGSVVAELEPLGDAAFAAPAAVPIDGDWKTLVRLHDDRVLAAVPIYLPEDPAIPAAGVPAPDREVTRELMSDKEILLREARDVSFGLTAAASSVLAALVVAWVLAMWWGLRRLEPRPPPAGTRVGARSIATD
ncbi:MAG: hypothetical protein M3238_01430 [Actinomycetota bacterium]|nr:hypothetical protein [Actinomycetota bacterium]